MSVVAGELVSIQFTTNDPSTGALQDADALPTGVVVRAGVDTADVVTIVHVSTGVYRASFTVGAYTAGDEMQCRVAATVAGQAGGGIVWVDSVEDARWPYYTPPPATPVLGTGRAQVWWGSTRTGDRIADVQSEIDDDPASLVLIRQGVLLDAQTIRLLTPAPTSADSRSEGGHEAKADLILLGTISFDVRREDTFLLSGQLYRVIYVGPEQPSSSERREAGAVQVQ